MDFPQFRHYLYRALLFVHVFFDVFAANTTTSSPTGSQKYNVQEKEKAFPVWLIGVIILSSIALTVLVATIVQRIMRRRAERHEQYRMAS